MSRLHWLWFLTGSVLAGLALARFVPHRSPAATLPGATPVQTGITPTAQPGPIHLTDITASSGIAFVHNSGAFGLKWMPETMGSGVAFIDYNNDGYPDIFLVNGRDWTNSEIAAYQAGAWSANERIIYARYHRPGVPRSRFIPTRPARQHTHCALYHNNHNNTFSDVTRGSGLDLEMQGMGVAVGDYDNDGRLDLYVTGLGRNYLFHNDGGGKFREVAQAAGVADAGWSSSAAWVDYDKDGNLDLFVCHYIQWAPASDAYETINWHDKSYAPPRAYTGEANRLYRNESTHGKSRFADVSVAAGIQKGLTAAGSRATLAGKSLGVTICDLNQDGWPDIVVANDTCRNYAFINNHHGAFAESALRLGLAYDNQGRVRSGMGIDAADIDHSGRTSLVVGNFAREMMGLWRSRGEGDYRDFAPATALGAQSRYLTTFGCSFVDLDNDGWMDLLAANGHIEPSLGSGQHTITYREPLLLFHNDGRGNYHKVGPEAGAVLAIPFVGRGLACADLDLDGDVDAVITQNGGPPVVLRNDAGHKGNAVRLILQGAQSNRSGIGAVISLPAEHVRRTVHSGSSYLSQSELPITLGLGHNKTIEALEVSWPSGRHTHLRHLAVNQIFTINEDRGLLQQQPFAPQAAHRFYPDS